MENHLLETALRYASYGWRVVPIKPGGKVPIAGKDWQKKATSDPEKIAAWWEATPNANVGIALGEDSGIIDFEGDGPEAEKTFLAIFGHDPPVTCTYTSQRGKHRIFRYRGDLPGQGKNHFKVGDLEIRTGYGGKGAQSVFPPSVHAEGAQYTWIVSDEDCPPAEISDAVSAWLWNWAEQPTSDLPGVASGGGHGEPKDWEKVSEGVSDGDRNETLASYCGALFRDMADVFNAGAMGRTYHYVKAWNEQNNPPLPLPEL